MLPAHQGSEKKKHGSWFGERFGERVAILTVPLQTTLDRRGPSRDRLWGVASCGSGYRSCEVFASRAVAPPLIHSERGVFRFRKSGLGGLEVRRAGPLPSRKLL